MTVQVNVRGYLRSDLSNISQVDALVAKPALNLNVPNIEDYGSGVGRGDVVVDTAAFQLAAAAGKAIKLRPDTEYRLGKRVVFSQGTSFICEGPRNARILMMTGAGQFDLASYSPSKAWGDNHVGFYADSLSRPSICGISFAMQANDAIRCCVPIALSQCSDVLVDDIEISGYGFAYFGLVSVRSCAGGVINGVYGHDCNPNQTTLGTGPQLTLIEVDNARINGVNSSALHILGTRCNNILFGPDAQVAYHQQTDCINLQGLGYGGHSVRDVRATLVGEVVDTFSDSNHITGVSCQDIAYTPLKFGHGASNNVANSIRCDGTGLSGVLLYGSNVDNASIHNTDNNHISDVVITDIGRLWSTYASEFSIPFGVFIDGEHDIHGCSVTNNYVQASVHGYNDGTQNFMNYACFKTGTGVDDIATGNRFLLDGRNFTHNNNDYFSGLSNAAPFSLARPKGRATELRAYLSAATSCTNSHAIPFDTVDYDDMDEFSITDHQLVCVAHTTIQVTGSIRVPGLPTGRRVGVAVTKAGVTYGSSAATPNTSGSNVEVEVGYTTRLQVAPGDNVQVVLVYTKPDGTPLDDPTETLTVGGLNTQSHVCISER